MFQTTNQYNTYNILISYVCVCEKNANVLLTLLNLHPLSSFPMTFGNMVISSSSRFRPILLRNLADHRRVATKFLKESYACIMVVRCNDIMIATSYNKVPGFSIFHAISKWWVCHCKVSEANLQKQHC